MTFAVRDNHYQGEDQTIVFRDGDTEMHVLAVRNTAPKNFGFDLDALAHNVVSVLNDSTPTTNFTDGKNALFRSKLPLGVQFRTQAGASGMTLPGGAEFTVTATCPEGLKQQILDKLHDREALGGVCALGSTSIGGGAPTSAPTAKLS
jgi:hypothetical protein